ncbi:MAG: cob(I)yrinic acid a,c-diamide adenosyltransferase [Anaerolineae bacterium]|nr:cob(I)yrinic acid a,c-diamide adenosyltransferase [Anaerolineae bacterium]
MNKSPFYTGKGDRGDTTRLEGKGRIAKDSAAIETLGALDEAACAVGAARARMQNPQRQAELRIVQQHLSRLMAHVSATPESRTRHAGVGEFEIEWLEQQIAALEEGLPPLKAFVLPGDTSSDAACHIARATVRRAERRLVTLCTHEPHIETTNLAYLNRLSAYLYILALRESPRTDPSQA